jgi:hypothetical protein
MASWLCEAEYYPIPLLSGENSCAWEDYLHRLNRRRKMRAMAHAYNPSDLGVRNQEGQGSRSAQAKS